MNEPYLLESINDENPVERRQTRNRTRRKKETQVRNQHERRRRKPRKNKPSKRWVHTFSAWVGQRKCLILSLRFVRRMNATMLVRLFQDFPSQLAYLWITMKSSSDRLPRRTGLCVLFHAHQLLIITVGPRTKWWITRRIVRIGLKNANGGWWRCMWIRGQCKSGSARWWWRCGCGEWWCWDAIIDRRKFRSQTSDNMERWKSSQQGEESEEKRSEERRCRCRKGRKVAKHCVFSWFCGSGGLKSRLAKAPGAETSGEMRDEKLHAVVARSRFRSEKAQSTSGSDHFWKLRCWKSARRCGAKHVWK